MEAYTTNAILGGMTMAIELEVAISAVENGAEKPPCSTIAGIRTAPSAATVAGPEPEIAPKKQGEKEPEGGKRCFKCYELRLRKTAELAKAEAYDYFTTTLTISPLKNSVKLNETGLKLQEEYGVNYLLSDFKKQEGYKRSIELSKEYGLYRQNYCGCVYSRQQILMSK